MKAAIVSCLALVALVACKKEQPKPEPRMVLTITAQASQRNQRTFPGTLEPRFSTQLAFRVGGRVTRRAVSVGDRVKKGDVIATIDSTALAAGAMAARANVDASDAKQRNAEQSRARQERLLQAQATPQSAMDTATSSRDTADASVAEARARLNKAREDLSYGTLRADFDGVITIISFEVGQTVAPNQVIAEMADPNVVDVVVDVPDSTFDELKIYDEVTAKTTAAPVVDLSGSIRQLSPAAEQRTRTFRVWVGLPSAPPNVRLGTTVYASFAEKFPAAVRVPVQAVLDKDDTTNVWVVEDNVVHLRKVTCVDRKGRNAVVTEGIRDGEHVVIAGVHHLQEGQAVKLGDGK